MYCTEPLANLIVYVLVTLLLEYSYYNLIDMFCRSRNITRNLFKISVGNGSLLAALSIGDTQLYDGVSTMH